MLQLLQGPEGDVENLRLKAEVFSAPPEGSGKCQVHGNKLIPINS